MTIADIADDGSVYYTHHMGYDFLLWAMGNQIRCYGAHTLPGPAHIPFFIDAVVEPNFCTLVGRRLVDSEWIAAT